MPRPSPALQGLGGFYLRMIGNQIRVGLRVSQAHLNSRDLLHGGVLATLADTGIGYAIALPLMASDPASAAMATTSLTVDYVAPCRGGDWLETQLDSHTRTGRTVFAVGRVVRGDAVVALVRALFTIAKAPE